MIFRTMLSAKPMKISKQSIILIAYIHIYSCTICRLYRVPRGEIEFGDINSSTNLSGGTTVDSRSFCILIVWTTSVTVHLGRYDQSIQAYY